MRNERGTLTRPWHSVITAIVQTIPLAFHYPNELIYVLLHLTKRLDSTGVRRVHARTLEGRQKAGRKSEEKRRVVQTYTRTFVLCIYTLWVYSSLGNAARSTSLTGSIVWPIFAHHNAPAPFLQRSFPRRPLEPAISCLFLNATLRKMSSFCRRTFSTIWDLT